MIYDYIIIGSGFGGSLAGLRLVEKGYRVLMLEQGKRYHPGDFPKTNMHLPKYLWWPALRFFGIQKLTFYPTTSILSGVGVGGGSLVYANTLYIPPDEFFRNKTWSHFGDWKSLLKPYYDRASFMLGRQQYLRKNTEDVLLREVAADMHAADTFDSVFVGVHLNGQDDAKDPYFNGLGPLRKSCTECAGCMVGCREGAKNSLDHNYLWFAEQLGLEILPETKAEIIRYEDQLYHIEARSATGLFRGKPSIFTAKGLILAGGTLGTLGILLKQKSKYGTMPGLSDKLGCGLRTNAETLCAVSGAPVKLNNGLAITSVFRPDPFTHIEIVKYPDGSNAMKWFFGLSVGNAKTAFGRALKLLRRTILHPGVFLRIVFNFRWSSHMVIFLVMQTVDNAMKMVWKKTLFGGRIRIDNHGQERVPAYIPVGQEVMERYARKAGGIPQNILLEVVFNRPTTAHILGGCPMSESSESGVVDADLKVHGYPGCYITDGSVIQGNIGVNPSLTITAMAEYAMDKIPPKPGTTLPELSIQLNCLEKEWKKKNSN